MARKVSLSAIVVAAATVIALSVAFITPVLAHHKSGHAQGGGQAQSSDRDGDADRDPNTNKTEADDDDGALRVGGDAGSRHPAGKDKRIEAGGSANQGKSESDPDDNVGPKRRECSEDGPADPRGGCTDKPDGAGGVYDTDQDGNNGCGNDQDFDDDNNGWCGKPGQIVGGAGVVAPRVGIVEEEEVLGEIIFRSPPLGEVLERPAAPEEEVLGARVTREAAPEVAAEAQAQPEGEGALPFTGAGLGGTALAGLALMTAGGALLRIRRS